MCYFYTMLDALIYIEYFLFVLTFMAIVMDIYGDIWPFALGALLLFILIPNKIVKHELQKCGMQRQIEVESLGMKQDAHERRKSK